MTAASNSVWLALHLPRLSTDRLIRSGRAPEGRAFAVYAKQEGAFLLACVDAQAAAFGLRAGMSLADARAIHPQLAAIEAEPAEDARTLERIALWCGRFSPVAALDPPDGLLLDIGGCGHLFGGDESLRRQILSRLAAQGFAAQAAFAPTPGAAWALARYGGACVSAAPDGLAAALAPLPVEALRLDEAAAALLRRLGLKRIGQLFAAPRASFAARAGERALLRLDRALGRAPEPLDPLRPPPAIFALRRFLEPLFNVEAILEAAQVLCADIVAGLDRRGAGARRCALHLFGVDGRDRVIEIGLSRPEREAAALLRLLREKLMQAGESLDAEFGIEAARLDVLALERIEPGPRTLIADAASAAGSEKLAAMADLVAARLGQRRVLRPRFAASHRPERASGWSDAPSASGASQPPPADAVMRRPLSLFARPQQIEAIATVPDGPPIRFRWRRVLREVARAEGPERIAGDWLGADAARDYYRVEDKTGRRYWLFREGCYGDGEPPRWYVHGLFA